LPHLYTLQDTQQPQPGDSLLHWLLLLLLWLLVQCCHSKQHDCKVFGTKPWQLVHYSSHQRMQQLLP
jgi:hypothetical protein